MNPDRGSELSNASKNGPDEKSQSLPLYRSIQRRADDHREAFVETLSRTGFYDAIEAMLGFWLELEAAYAVDSELEALRPLVVRARQDVEASVFLLDNGLYSLAVDCARDLMEIEFLFRHFVNEPSALREWLGANEKTRKDRFGPNSLRQAEAARRRIPVADLPDSADYKGHSQSLHVSLRTVFPRGIREEFSESLIPESMVMFEVLRHAQKTSWQVWKLASIREPDLQERVDSSKFKTVDDMIENVKHALTVLGFPTSKL